MITQAVRKESDVKNRTTRNFASSMLYPAIAAPIIELNPDTTILGMGAAPCCGDVHAIITDSTLKEAARVARVEFSKRLMPERMIDDVEVNLLEAAYGGDYIEAIIILKDDRPTLDKRKWMHFYFDMDEAFESSGVIPAPSVSHLRRSELPKRKARGFARRGLWAESAPVVAFAHYAPELGMGRSPCCGEIHAVITADTLMNAVRITREELPKYLTPDRAIYDVRAEVLYGRGEDYVHVRIILEDGCPTPDSRKLMKFSKDTHPIFESAEVIPFPAISYSYRSESPK